MYDYFEGLTVFLFFFFKQKTAYEMRISDWSSDVCSSDLLEEALLDASEALRFRRAVLWRAGGRRLDVHVVADRQQAHLVGEFREVDLADVLRRHLTVDLGENLAARVDGDVDGVGRDRDARQDGEADRKRGGEGKSV